MVPLPPPYLRGWVGFPCCYHPPGTCAQTGNQATRTSPSFSALWDSWNTAFIQLSCSLAPWLWRWQVCAVKIVLPLFSQSGFQSPEWEHGSSLPWLRREATRWQEGELLSWQVKWFLTFQIQLFAEGREKVKEKRGRCDCFSKSDFSEKQRRHLSEQSCVNPPRIQAVSTLASPCLCKLWPNFKRSHLYCLLDKNRHSETSPGWGSDIRNNYPDSSN